MELDYRNRLRQEAVLEVLQANNRKRNGKLRKKPQDDNVVQIEPLIKPGESFDTEKIVWDTKYSMSSDWIYFSIFFLIYAKKFI